MVTPELEVLELLLHQDSISLLKGKITLSFLKKKKNFWGTPKVLVQEGELLTNDRKRSLESAFLKLLYKVNLNLKVIRNYFVRSN
jgi:membrane-bound serine protease (ClpP class)